jgi:eukaryotic-like serine/threonine-protein kinase
MELEGRLLGDRYELRSVLATGGMGQVWQASDRLLKRQVAVKVLRGDISADPTFLARFRAEAQHTAALTHPNIAAVYDYGEVPGDGEHRAYLVMELVDGEPLSALLARERRLPVPLTLSILRQLAGALASAHAAGVVHRDVKPANVLVTPDGRVKITDFGIASSAASVPLTRTGQVIGTAQYLSPEQAQGAKASPTSDVYAAGVVAYECLAGRRPFDGESAVQIALMQIRDTPAPLPPDVPAQVRALVEQAMAKDPAQRFADGAALRAAVERVIPVVAPSPDHLRTMTTTLPLPLPDRPRKPDATVTLPAAVPTAAAASQPTAVLPPSVTAAVRPGRRGNRAVVVAVAVVALVLLAAAVFAILHSGDEPSSPASGTTARTTSPGTTTPVAPSSSPPPAIVLDPADYTGRPVDAVQAELTALHLQVLAEPVELRGVPAGRVVKVDPTGSLAPGSTVTVIFAAAPSPAPAPTHKDDGKGGKENPGHGKKDD